MAIKYFDECVSCTSVGLNCLGNSCINKNVKHYYCDKCKKEFDVLYEYDGEELCEECVLGMLKKVE